MTENIQPTPDSNQAPAVTNPEASKREAAVETHAKDAAPPQKTIFYDDREVYGI
jgi:hypothetical protein